MVSIRCPERERCHDEERERGRHDTSSEQIAVSEEFDASLVGELVTGRRLGRGWHLTKWR